MSNTHINRRRLARGNKPPHPPPKFYVLDVYKEIYCPGFHVLAKPTPWKSLDETAVHKTIWICLSCIPYYTILPVRCSKASTMQSVVRESTSSLSTSVDPSIYTAKNLVAVFGAHLTYVFLWGERWNQEPHVGRQARPPAVALNTILCAVNRVPQKAPASTRYKRDSAIPHRLRVPPADPTQCHGQSMCNHIPPANGVKRGESASPERKPVPAPRYNPETWKDVGKGFLKALLDVEGASVWSRLPLSRFKTLERVRELKLVVGCVEGNPTPGEGSTLPR